MPHTSPESSFPARPELTDDDGGWGSHLPEDDDIWDSFDQSDQGDLSHGDVSSVWGHEGIEASRDVTERHG